jgi:hypothetical protein
VAEDDLWEGLLEVTTVDDDETLEENWVISTI